jgi:hypothetical protein
VKILLIIFAILAIGAAIYFYNLLTGRITDTDGDLIPDVIEDKIVEIKEEATAIKEATKKKAVKVKKAVKKGISEVSDVVAKPKRGRPAGSKNASKK